MNKIFGFLMGLAGIYFWHLGFYEDAVMFTLISIAGFVSHISDQIKGK